MSRLLAALSTALIGVSLIAGPTMAAQPSTTIVSTSGVPHHDVADLTESRFWHEGLPRGINESWREAIDITIGQIASENPDAVFHTGDMVSGKWGVDVDNTGIFGPVTTDAQRRRAIRRAAHLYYGQNKRWWAAHGLHPYFGVGDHEMGDISSSGRIDNDTFKYRAQATWRNAWARAFTDDGTRFDSHPPRGQHRKTAYATLIDDIGFLTLDPITTRPDGVHVRIGAVQMRWLDGALRDLRRRGARWLIVQCEAPARGPNRRSHSSRSLLEDDDRLWRLLADHDVDLLLASEFHKMTTRTNAGTTPVQVVHGGQMHRGSVNYLVVDTFRNRLELQLKQMAGRRTGRGEIAAPAAQRANDGVRIYRSARVVGTMTIHRNGSLSDRTGYLTEGFVCSRPGTDARCAAVRHAERGRAVSTGPLPEVAPHPEPVPGRATSAMPLPSARSRSGAAVSTPPSPGTATFPATVSGAAPSATPFTHLDVLSVACTSVWSGTWPQRLCPGV